MAKMKIMTKSLLTPRSRGTRARAARASHRERWPDGSDSAKHAGATMNPPLPVTPLRPGTMHFFDTNFLVLPAATLPKLNRVPNSSRWITETTRQEVIETLGEQSAREVLDGTFHTLRF